jgi:hypothetical protein
MSMIVSILGLLALLATTSAFIPSMRSKAILLGQPSQHRSVSSLSMAQDQVGKIVEIDVPMNGMDGESLMPIPIRLRPIFANSVFLTVVYDVPFGLNVDKPPKNFPCPFVTKDGKGGEKVGDVLRATSCWSQGFNAAGATSDIMSFAGNVKWRRSVFDTTGAPWEQVVQALTSNTNERCSQVSLVFEREVEGDPVDEEAAAEEKGDAQEAQEEEVEVRGTQ